MSLAEPSSFGRKSADCSFGMMMTATMPPRNMSTPATAKPVVRFSMKHAPIMVPIGAPMVEPAP